MTINTHGLTFREINEAIRAAGERSELIGCLGQRFIAAGMNNVTVTVNGIPGNALGAYLNGAEITVNGNAQDAVGDTMNDGTIIVHGAIGDTAGYAMRGGRILVRGDAGYRAGIHMKEYVDKIPVIVIGGCAGSFLGEYQAGGVIVVLGLERSKKAIVGDFPCTGMHGGKVILRSDCAGISFPDQVSAKEASPDDLASIREYVELFCSCFALDPDEIMTSPFTVVTPDSNNPYKRLYVAN